MLSQSTETVQRRLKNGVLAIHCNNVNKPQYVIVKLFVDEPCVHLVVVAW
jgi:hypothetical protein